MNNDTALILLLADRQREIEALRADNEVLRRAAGPDADMWIATARADAVATESPN